RRGADRLSLAAAGARSGKRCALAVGSALESVVRNDVRNDRAHAGLAAHGAGHQAAATELAGRGTARRMRCLPGRRMAFLRGHAAGARYDQTAADMAARALACRVGGERLAVSAKPRRRLWFDHVAAAGRGGTGVARLAADVLSGDWAISPLYAESVGAGLVVWRDRRTNSGSSQPAGLRPLPLARAPGTGYQRGIWACHRP